MTMREITEQGIRLSSSTLHTNFIIELKCIPGVLMSSLNYFNEQNKHIDGTTELLRLEGYSAHLDDDGSL